MLRQSLSGYKFRLCKEKSLEVFVAGIRAMLECFFVFDFFGEELDVLFFEELCGLCHRFGRVIRQVHLHVRNVFEQRLETIQELVVHDKIV